MTVYATQDMDLLLKVEGFNLSGLSLSRVQTYIQLLSNLIGKQKDCVHLSYLKDGSLEARVSVDYAKADQVTAWLHEANSPLGGEPRQAYENFSKAMQKDGGNQATATIIDMHTRKIILSIAPEENKLLPDQIVSQKDILRGRITTLGEAANSNRYTGIIVGQGLPIRFTYNDSIAPLLKPFLWSETIELSGDAKWIRKPTGQWKLARFEATGVKELQQNSLRAIRDQIKEIGGFGFQEDNLAQFLKDIR